MRPRRHLAAPTLVALGVISLPIAGCDTPTVEPKTGAPPIARVATVTAERMTVRRTTEQPGQIESAETTPIHAKLSGYVASVAVNIGDKVKKGQVLAELRMPEVEADLHQKRAMIDLARFEMRQAEATVEVSRAGVTSAEAKVVEIRAGIRRADADADRWRAEFGRIDQLVRERAQTGSLLDETSNKLKAAEASREEVQARVKSAEAALAEARALLDKARSDVETATSHVEVARLEAEQAEAMAGYRKIVAPFDGVVTRRGVDVGHLTTAGAGGETLFIVARSDLATISVGVPEADAPHVNPGDPALIRLPALAGRIFKGQVTRTAWALDPSTRTLRAEIDLPNHEDTLRPGLYAYATIIAEEHKDVLTLPGSAVIDDGGRSYCVAFVDGRARRRELKLGLVNGKRTEVISGLIPGELVVEANAASLEDGQPIERVVPPGTSPKPKG